MKRLDAMLTPKEKKLYRIILDDIAKNDDFYSTSSPEEITDHLVNDCGLNKSELYRLFKKITLVSGEWK